MNKVSETEFLKACLKVKQADSHGSKRVVGLRISADVIRAFARYFEVDQAEAVNRIAQTAKGGAFDAQVNRSGQVSTLYLPGSRGSDLLTAIEAMIG